VPQGLDCVVPSLHPVLQGQGYWKHRAVRVGGDDIKLFPD